MLFGQYEHAEFSRDQTGMLVLDESATVVQQSVPSPQADEIPYRQLRVVAAFLSMYTVVLHSALAECWLPTFGSWVGH